MRPISGICALVFFAVLTIPGLPASEMAMGINIGEPYEFDQDQLFADAMKQSRPWGTLANFMDPSVAIDADGWPLTDASVAVISQGTNIGGTYRLTFNGRAVVTPAVGQIQILNSAYDPLTGIGNADVVVDPLASQLALSFTQTEGGVRNVRLMRPGYTSETFTRPIQDLIQPFGCIRSMPFTVTNHNPVSRWQDRTRPTHATQNRRLDQMPAGAAWEYVVELANLTDKDVWICIPDQADDEYIRELASLLHTTLEPERCVYIEYSNEVWNSAFTQYARNLEAARNEVASGGSPLAFDGEIREEVWARRRVAQRILTASDIFRSVFGDVAMMSRVRPVLAGFDAIPDTVGDGLEFIAQVYGPPSRYLYAVAGGIYFGLSPESNLRTDLTVDQIMAELPAGIDRVAEHARLFTAWARYYGLRNLAYEGGPSLTGSASNAAKREAMRDPRMRDLVVDCVDRFHRAGGDFFVYFTATGHGGFGLAENVASQDTPKIQAIQDLLSRPQAESDVGAVLPCTVEAGQFDLQSGGLTPGQTEVPLGEGRWCAYLLRVPSTGTYRLAPATSADATGGRLEAFLDAQPVAEWDVPITGVGSQELELPEVALDLEAGLTVLRMRGTGGSFRLHRIRLEAVTPEDLVFLSSPNYTPSTAYAGQVIRFNAGPTDGQSVDYTWDFRDGSDATSGEIVTHAFAAPGLWPVRCIARDTPSGRTGIAELPVTVHAAPQDSEPGQDFDGDGIANQFDQDDDGDQLADDVDPDPFTVLPLTILRLRGKVDFARPDADRVTMQAQLPQLPAGFFAVGQIVHLDIGGVESTFTLNEAGRAAVETGRMVLSLRSGKLSVRLEHGDWLDDWADEGVRQDVSVDRQPLTFSISVTLGGRRYAGGAEVLFSARPGRRGSFR